MLVAVRVGMGLGLGSGVCYDWGKGGLWLGVKCKG